MKRRKFLQSLITILGLTGLISFLYPLVRFLAPASGKAKVKQIRVNKSDLPVGEAKDVALDSLPAIIINRPGKGMIAFSRICTHLGCLVDYDKGMGRIVCPCHGAIFDLEGNVLSGPPPKPLAKLPLRIEGDFILIG